MHLIFPAKGNEVIHSEASLEGSSCLFGGQPCSLSVCWRVQYVTVLTKRAVNTSALCKETVVHKKAQQPNPPSILELLCRWEDRGEEKEAMGGRGASRDSSPLPVAEGKLHITNKGKVALVMRLTCAR